MNPIKKIAGINLLVLLVYSLLIRIISKGDSSGHQNEDAMAVVIFSAFAVGLHVFVCVVAALRMFSSNRRPMGRAWLLTSGLVLLIGFSVCLGNASY